MLKPGGRTVSVDFVEIQEGTSCCFCLQHLIQASWELQSKLQKPGRKISILSPKKAWTSCQDKTALGT